jgi:hypothetical protein
MAFIIVTLLTPRLIPPSRTTQKSVSSAMPALPSYLASSTLPPITVAKRKRPRPATAHEVVLIFSAGIGIFLAFITALVGAIVLLWIAKLATHGRGIGDHGL